MLRIDERELNCHLYSFIHHKASTCLPMPLTSTFSKGESCGGGERDGNGNFLGPFSNNHGTVHVKGSKEAIFSTMKEFWIIL